MSSKVETSAVRRPPNAGKGRKKGVPNKTTATMKQAIAAVYVALQKDHAADNGLPGDHEHFTQWAKDNATEFYKIAAKLLPLQITGDEGGPIQAAVSVAFVKTDVPRGS